MASFGLSFPACFPPSSPDPDAMDWSPAPDVTVERRRRQDEATGLINLPRMAPHRWGSKPLKSSLKMSKFRSWKQVRFASTRDTEITGTSMITGDEVLPSQPDWRSNWTPEFHEDDQDQEPSDDDSSESLWNPSPLLDDVPMRGIDFVGDMAASRYERIETTLDCVLDIAEKNGNKNKASCPISSKKDRHLHPCLGCTSKTRRRRNPMPSDRLKHVRGRPKANTMPSDRPKHVRGRPKASPMPSDRLKHARGRPKARGRQI